MGDIMRFNWTVLRALLGMHRTPLLREQVKRLKLNPKAPFPSERKLADVVRLQRKVLHDDCVEGLLQ